MTVTLQNKQEHPKLTFRGVFAARRKQLNNGTVVEVAYAKTTAVTKTMESKYK